MNNCLQCPNYDQCPMIQSAKYLLDKSIVLDDLSDAMKLIEELKAKENMLKKIREDLEFKYTHAQNQYYN